MKASPPPAEPPPPADIPPPAAPAPARDPAAPAAWPEWFRTADAVLAVLLMIPAFLVASHAARNSDLWPHLAAGRLIAEGKYEFGTDPFSHATAGRTWVNHSWLLDILAYKLYAIGPAGGAILVGVKAAGFALAVAFLLFIRRPGQTLWPWVAFGGLAIVAAAPHTGLRPIVVSAPFLAATLFVLLRLDWHARPVRNVAVLAGLFWLWANLDAWFVLGPLAVALVLLGEVLQGVILKGKDDPADAGPPAKWLGIALAAGAVACMLNPHHIRVWQLPAELGVGLPAAMASDPAFAQLTVTPLSELYRTQAGFGYNANGLAYAVLMLSGGIVLAVGFGRLRFSHLLLWLGFAFLSLLQFRLILFFAIAAVPLAAAAANGISAGITLGVAAHPATRLLLTLSGVARLLAIPAVLGLAAAAWPGWLHSKPTDPSLANRAAWAVEPDPGHVRTAKLFQDWRAAGKLPPAAKGIHLVPDAANYFAYFAPAEKVFVNTRYAFHAPELADLLKARKALKLPTKEDEQYDTAAAKDVCEARDLAYFVYSGQTSPPQALDLRPVLILTINTPDWVLWHVDGRAAVLGRTAARDADPAAFDAVTFDPVRLAFAPNQDPVPDGKPARPNPAAGEWYDDFVSSPKPLPVEALDSLVYTSLSREFYGVRAQAHRRAWPLAFSAAAGGSGVLPFLGQRAMAPPPLRPDDSDVAYRVLGVRAARRAAVANPDHPETYAAQADAFSRNPPAFPGTTPNELVTQQVTALRMYLDRVPPPATSPLPAARAAYAAAAQLSELYRDPLGMIDLYRQAVLLASEYATRMAAGEPNQENKKKIVEMRDGFKKEADVEFAARNDDYELFVKAQNPKPWEQMLYLAQKGLGGKALALFDAEKNAAKADFGPDPQRLVQTMIQLEIIAGRLPDAAADVEQLLEKLKDDAADPRSNPLSVRQATAVVNALQAEIWRLSGNSTRLGEYLEANAPKGSLSETEKVFVTLAARGEGWRPQLAGGAVAGGFGSVWAAEATARPFQPWSAEANFYLNRGMLHVLEGNMALAKDRFRQTLRPQGIELPEGSPQRGVAERYLKMIESAEAGK